MLTPGLGIGNGLAQGQTRGAQGKTGLERGVCAQGVARARSAIGLRKVKLGARKGGACAQGVAQGVCARRAARARCAQGAEENFVSVKHSIIVLYDSYKDLIILL